MDHGSRRTAAPNANEAAMGSGSGGTMLGGATVDNDAIGDASGVDHGSGSKSHDGSVVSADPLDFKVVSDSDGQIFLVERRIIADATMEGVAFEEGDLVTFNTSSGTNRVTSLMKRSAGGTK